MHNVSNCESYAVIVAISQEITFHYLSPANNVDSLCCCEPFSPSWTLSGKLLLKPNFFFFFPEFIVIIDPSLNVILFSLE